MLSWFSRNPAPVEAANQEINLATTVFNPENPAHRALLTKRLETFKTKAQEIWTMDKWYGVVITGEVLLCASSVFSFLMGAVGMCGLFYTALKVSERSKYQTDFDRAKQELYDVYQWSAKLGPIMTHDGQFQAIAKALLTCTLDYKQLMPWDLTKVENQILSSQFLTILEESPHRVKMIFNGQDTKQVKLPVWLQPMAAVVNPLAALDPRQLANNRWTKFGADTANYAALTWYGTEFATPAP